MGKARIGAVTEMDMDGLKSWLRSNETKKPMAYVEPVQKSEPTPTTVKPTSVDVKKQEPTPTVERPEAKPEPSSRSRNPSHIKKAFSA